MSDADEYDYPPEWARPGATPPRRRPATDQPADRPIETLTSGCPDPLADERLEHDDYPSSWRSTRR